MALTWWCTGDRLYFVELLTQLYDDIVNWSSKIGVQLATHPVPPLHEIGLKLQPTAWSVKDVCKVLKAVGLEEYIHLFVEHRIQGTCALMDRGRRGGRAELIKRGALREAVQG